MKIFAIIISSLFCLSITEAQTPSVQKEKKPVKIKTYSLAMAKDFNSWDVGGNIGFAYPYSDISSSGLGNFSFGIDVTKFLTHSFALQARIIHASLSGQDVNKPDFSFNTTINYDATLNAVFQFGNISFLKRIPDFAIFTSIGFGIITYSPDVYIDGGNVPLYGIYSQYSQPLDTMDYQGTSDLIIPLSIGAKYRISDKISLTAEYSYRNTNSDKLDGFYKLLSDEDDYSYFGIGVSYHLGNQTKTLEWVNPLQTVYNDFYDMKEKMDQLGKDADGDGVADLYDKEPGTPADSKVYGDGTSVDSDGDGVPDYNDAEKFSEKNAKVDGTGREIDANKKSKSELPLKEVIREVVRVDTVFIEKEKIHDVVSEPGKTNATNTFNNYRDLPSVYFASEEDGITSKNNKTLDYIGHVMQANPKVNFILLGNCDAIGDKEYNTSLAKRRAESVKNYLVSKHRINANRLTVQSSGDLNSVVGANPMNRRVDIKVKD